MKLFLLCTVIFMASCSKHRPAPVIDASKNKKYSQKTKPMRSKSNNGFAIVKKGDTLYSIGFIHNIGYKKLASINSIPPPYRIYPGQKLHLKTNKSAQTHQYKPPISHQQKIKATTKKTNKSTSKTSSPHVVKQPQVSKPRVKHPPKKPVIQQAPSSNSRWIWPVSGKVVSTFSNSDVARKGIDISVKVGSSVYASNNGTVVYSGDGLRGYGELIIIKHSNNLLSAYAHNNSRLVKEGASVKQGQVIAKSGKGTDGKSLLHFEIRKNGKPVNPIKYLPNR